MRTITRVVPCTGPNGVGVHPSLERAVAMGGEDARLDGHNDRSPEVFDFQVHSVAAEFRSMYDKAIAHHLKPDIVEFAPLGRRNDSQGQWAWPTRDEFDGPIMEGFKWFLDGLQKQAMRDNVRASFGCPRHPTYRGFRKDMERLPPCQWQFDDMGDRSLKIVRRLNKFVPLRTVVLETVPTDTPTEPRKATRFDLPKGHERHQWQVRADVVRVWVEKWRSSPLDWWFGDDLCPRNSGVFGLRLSLYLPSRDCSPDPKKPDAPCMTAPILASVLPLFENVTIQGDIPDAHAVEIRKWREAGQVPAMNTEGVR